TAPTARPQGNCGDCAAVVDAAVDAEVAAVEAADEAFGVPAVNVNVPSMGCESEATTRQTTVNLPAGAPDLMFCVTLLSTML
ncbi:hypothetical protein SB679_25560, partial [Chryseobacterium sp. SIMBA_029]